VDFCETLFRFRAMAREARPLVEWRDLLSSLLEQTVAVTPANAHQHREIRSALADVAARAERAGFAEPVDLETVQSRVDLDLGARTSTYGFLGGGVTFCALVPMRSIPFRVVCLLGMSDGAYPRSRRPLGFDLIAERPRAGDRSQRDDDRYLFLEALLSARERLLVTYVGQGIQDPREIPPSVVVSELLDVLDESFTAVDHERVRDRVVVRHPLQPFSPRYFGADPDARLFSYSAAYLGGAEAVGRERKPVPPFLARPLPPDPEPPREIAIDDLTRFFRNPSKAFLERRLALRLGGDLDVLEDREPLELDALARWKVGDDLLKRFLAGDDLEHAFAPVRASGAIPSGTVGECLYQDLRGEVEDIGREARRLREDAAPRPVPIDVTIAGVRVTGALAEVWPRGQIRCQYSRLGRASEIDLWIRHLLLCVSSPDECQARTFAAGRVEKGSGLLVVRFERVAEPREILEELVRSYLRGLSMPIPFFAQTARAYCSSLVKGEQVALAEARRVFEPGDYNPAAEGDDPYVARLYEGRDPLDPDFRMFDRESAEPLSFDRVARVVLSPLLAARTTE
jgi:exodeoxyribonuclease V gamma subunit